MIIFSHFLVSEKMKKTIALKVDLLRNYSLLFIYRENVRINSFGVFILFLYPGAFVELHTDHLEVISPLRKLRIFTAGVWHNVVLALVGYLGLCSIPYMVLPLFHLESGVAVTWIDEVGYC